MSTQATTATGRIVWHDLVTPDVGTATSFYTQLLGWELETWKPGEFDYPMITKGGQMHGGFVAVEGAEAPPPHWLAYVNVADVDATAARAESLGAKIYTPPTDIPEVGRFTVLGDPQGAVIGAIQTQGESPTPPGTGTFVWDELMADDLDAAKQFYGELLGWEAKDVDMGGGSYTLFNRDGTDVAGAMKKPDEAPMPAWTTYVGVDDVDATAQRAGELGGTVLMGPTEAGEYGRFAVVADPTGGVFGLYKSAS